MVIKHSGSCFDISPFIVADDFGYAAVYIELVLNDLTLSDGFREILVFLGRQPLLFPLS